MGKFQDLITKISAFTPDVIEEGILKILKENEPALVDANIDQLMSGEDATGKLLRSYASEQYAKFKKTLNPKGVTDLKLTGSFQEGIFVNAGSFPVIFDSTDEKTKDLKADYGNDILGLSQKSLSAVTKGYIKEDVQSLYRANILGI